MMRKLITISIFLILAWLVSGYCLFAYAQSESSDNNDKTTKDAVVENGDENAMEKAAEETSPSSEEVSTEVHPLGRVVDIVVEGEYKVKPSFVLRQISISKGDVIYQKDLDVSKELLDRLDMFYYINIEYLSLADLENPPAIDPKLPPAPEGVSDIVLHVVVYQETSYYIKPSRTGIIIGDKDIFDSGNTVEGSYFKSGKNFRYWYLNYATPQFLNSHNVGSFTISSMKDLFQVRKEDTYGLGDKYRILQRSFNFNLTTFLKDDYRIIYGINKQENDTSDFQGEMAGDDQHFILSGEKAPSHDDLIFSFTLSKIKLTGDPWTTGGYSWSIGTEQASENLFSDSNFGRYSLTGTEYLPVNYLADTFVLHGEYGTTSGNPPHYQKLRIGSILRGHTGLDYFGVSSIYLTGELRKKFWNDKIMGVAFVDMGKGFDSKNITFKNLEITPGMGIRIDMKRFWNWDVILRLDYGFGETGDRWTFGVSQDIFGSGSSMAGGQGGSSSCSG